MHKQLKESVLRKQIVGRIPSSDELIWLKRTFFSACRMSYTASWKNTFVEIKGAVRQSARVAVLRGRIAGEVRYA